MMTDQNYCKFETVYSNCMERMQQLSVQETPLTTVFYKDIKSSS